MAPAPGREEGIAGEAPGKHGKPFPQTPKQGLSAPSRNASAPREQEEGGGARLGRYLVSASPGGLWGTSQERCRHICHSTS